MHENPIALTRYASGENSLYNCINDCNGLASISASDKIIIKPNLVMWDDSVPVAPFGVFTTTRIIEDLLILLKDHGCTDITIGEGSVVLKKGAGTMQLFEKLGYTKLVKKYGVKLVDFNKSTAKEYRIHDDLNLQVAADAVEADCFINVPALKTHADSKVSLGIKNLKGCLKIASKKLCHHTTYNLDYCFSHIMDIIKPRLTIIDGIYALEQGPLFSGTAHRKDILLASQNFLGIDIVGAKILGYDSHEIEHIGHVAERNNLPADLDSYSIVGEKLENYVERLEWDWQWNEDNTGPAAFDKIGITGVSVPKYDETLCSGCSPVINMINMFVISAFNGKPLPSVEILNGKIMLASGKYDHSILVGGCMVKANKDNPNIKHAIPVKGCPPKKEELIAAMKEAGLSVKPEAFNNFFAKKKKKYDRDPRFDYTLYSA